MDNFLVSVNDPNVGLEVSDTQCRRNGASSRRLPAWQVTVHCVLAGVNVVDDEVDEGVVPPGVSPRVEHDAAAVEVVIGGAPGTTQLAPVGAGVLPTPEVGRGGQGVDASIEHELEGDRLELENMLCLKIL